MKRFLFDLVMLFFGVQILLKTVEFWVSGVQLGNGAQIFLYFMGAAGLILTVGALAKTLGAISREGTEKAKKKDE